MPAPAHAADRTQQRQAHRQWTRLRTQALAGYRELEKRADTLTKGQPRRVLYLVLATVQVWKRRGSQHHVTYLGPSALAGTKWQSTSSHKRAKGQVLDAWTDGEGRKVEGLGLLRRVHQGGGRLARAAGGGKNTAGRFRGNADGVMPGPEITGWTDEEYRALQAGPPPSPAAASVLPREPGESPEAHRDRERRHLAYLAKKGYQPAGP